MIYGIEKSDLMSSRTNLLGHSFPILKIITIHPTDINHRERFECSPAIRMDVERLPIL